MPQLKSAKSNIPSDDEALERYQQEIAQHPLLPLKKETELLRRISKGGDDGREAMQQLVAAKLRFVLEAEKAAKAMDPRIVSATYDMVSTESGTVRIVNS